VNPRSCWSRVGLDEVLVLGNAHAGAALGADNSERNGAVEAERAAQRQDQMAHLDFVGISEFRNRQVLGVDLEDGDIRIRIRADHLGVELAFVAQLDLQLLGALDHVIVGQDVAVVAHDHARTQALLTILAPGSGKAEEPVEKLVAEGRHRPGAGPSRLQDAHGGDMNHRRADLLRNARESLTQVLGSGDGRSATDRDQERHREPAKQSAPHHNVLVLTHFHLLLC